MNDHSKGSQRKRGPYFLVGASRKLKLTLKSYAMVVCLRKAQPYKGLCVPLAVKPTCPFWNMTIPQKHSWFCNLAPGLSIPLPRVSLQVRFCAQCGSGRVLTMVRLTCLYLLTGNLQLVDQKHYILNTT